MATGGGRTGTANSGAARPVRRPPRPAGRVMIVGGVVVLVILALVSLGYHPTRAQRAADLDAYLNETMASVSTCAGSVTESLSAVTAVKSGGHDRAAGLGATARGAGDCAPGTDRQLAEVGERQVPPSLASFHLGPAVVDLLRWADPDAEQVLTDAARLLRARGASQTTDESHLLRDLRALDARRAAIDHAFTAAIRATGAASKPPTLPG